MSVEGSRIDGVQNIFRFFSGVGDGNVQLAPHLTELAADLERLKPDALYALGGDVAPFAAKATQTIPIAFSVSTDPVKSGLVATRCAHPCGLSSQPTRCRESRRARGLDDQR